MTRGEKYIFRYTFSIRIEFTQDQDGDLTEKVTLQAVVNVELEGRNVRQSATTVINFNQIF